MAGAESSGKEEAPSKKQEQSLGVKQWYTFPCFHIVVSMLHSSTDALKFCFVFTSDTERVFLILYTGDNHEWALENPKSLWKKIVKEVQDYYHYKISW